MSLVDIPLPRFIERREDGLYVELAMLESADAMSVYVDRVFTEGGVFVQLNYPVLQNLIYTADSPALLEASVKIDDRHLVFFARDMRPFPLERQSLYRGAKIAKDGSNAEYLFEPVSIAREVEVPDHGPPDETGVARIIGSHIETLQEAATPNLDEFIAAMWLKGLRYGFNIAQITPALLISNIKESKRLIIAEAKAPIEGRSASIIEQTPALHRDNSPRLLPSGRMDLRCFANRFPQISAGTCLLKKVPRVLGIPGFDVAGKTLEPALPQDFDFASLAGPGTRLDITNGGEFVLATQDGFLHIDQNTHQLSVTDKIVNTEGINMRTTGNLSLTGSDFEERGEVQERRVVEGHNMVFQSNVFGHVISDGGKVEIQATLAGGAVKNRGGSIEISGPVSNAFIEDKYGSITLESAEGSLIVGKNVSIKTAIHCEILAETLAIETCIGSAVTARHQHIGSSKAWREAESIIGILVPDPMQWQGEVDFLTNEMVRLKTSQEEAAEKLAEHTNQPEFRQFLLLRQQVEAGSVKLNSAQEDALQIMARRFADAQKQVGQLKLLQQNLQRREDEILVRQAAITAEKVAAESLSHCELTQVNGETVVRTRKAIGTDLPFPTLSAKELHQLLRDRGLAADILFAASSGEFAWPKEDVPASSENPT